MHNPWRLSHVHDVAPHASLCVLLHGYACADKYMRYIRGSWVRIPPEAAHFSLEKKSCLGVVVLCCIVFLSSSCTVHVYIHTMYMYKVHVNVHVHTCVHTYTCICIYTCTCNTYMYIPVHVIVCLMLSAIGVATCTEAVYSKEWRCPQVRGAADQVPLSVGSRQQAGQAWSPCQCLLSGVSGWSSPS